MFTGRLKPIPIARVQISVLLYICIWISNRVRMLCCCPQIIYVARDAKYVAVSYYHHYRLMNGYTGSCEDFIEAFLAEIGRTYALWF